MDELLAKRGRLTVQLEKVLRRITEFPFFSELDMIQQVLFGVWLLLLNAWKVLCYINRIICLLKRAL